MTRDIHLDFETWNVVSIKDVGAWRYAMDPECEILCAAYSLDHGPVKLWRQGDPPPQDLCDAIEEGALIHAWNAAFEYAVLTYAAPAGWPMPRPSQMRCSMALAAFHSLPLSLEKAGAAVGAKILKDKDGTRLLKKFSMPRKPTKANPSTRIRPEDDPEDFEKLCGYCRQDVESELAILRELPLKSLPGIEQSVFELDLRINERGVEIDLEAAHAVIRAADRISEVLEEEVGQIIAPGVKSSQRAVVMEWAELRHGFKLENYQADYIRSVIKQSGVPKPVKRVLEIREALAKTSVTKYAKMVECACPDRRVRGTIQYYGAQRTGRFAGRLLQVHNLPRGSVKGIEQLAEYISSMTAEDFLLIFDKPMEAFSSLIRSMIVAPKGKIFFAADFANIEGRVLAWMAGQNDVVAQFASGDDLYKHMAASIFGVPYHKVDDFQRFVGKQAVLGCGYGMGAPKFLDTCIGYGQDIGLKTAKLAVTTYRKRNHMVVKFWYAVEEAAMNAIRQPGTVFKVRDVAYVVKDGYLWCRLPGKRTLAYKDPQIRDGSITYMGVDQTTSQWGRQHTYGGKLVENIVQAVSRDILVEAMLRAEEAGYEVAMTVHDEVVALSDSHSASVDHFVQILCVVPQWARGCPVAAAGWSGPRYKKD